MPKEQEEDRDRNMSGASEHATAGIGKINEAVWMCRLCSHKLCVKHPVMPKYALVNWMWLGREHPAYQNLTLAMRQLLGRGRAVLRLVVLRHRAGEDEEERGLIGNSILLSQCIVVYRKS